MIGNVWEWTNDRFARYHDHEPKMDPTGSPRGTERVKKGGSFLSDTEHSYRKLLEIDGRYFFKNLKLKMPNLKKGRFGLFCG